MNVWSPGLDCRKLAMQCGTADMDCRRLGLNVWISGLEECMYECTVWLSDTEGEGPVIIVKKSMWFTSYHIKKNS